MNRSQLWHAIRAACSIADLDSIVVVGSQSILGSFDDDQLPHAAARSLEVDLLPLAADTERVEVLADLIEGVAGEMSPFHDTHGFYLDGVDLTTCVLPDGWQDRLVPVSNDSTSDPTTGRQYTGWCLDPADLCVSKLCAGREKDREFVNAVFAAGLVDPELVRLRVDLVRGQHAARAAAAIAEFFPQR